MLQQDLKVCDLPEAEKLEGQVGFENAFEQLHDKVMSIKDGDARRQRQTRLDRSQKEAIKKKIEALTMTQPEHLGQTLKAIRLAHLDLILDQTETPKQFRDFARLTVLPDFERVVSNFYPYLRSYIQERIYERKRIWMLEYDKFWKAGLKIVDAFETRESSFNHVTDYLVIAYEFS